MDVFLGILAVFAIWRLVHMLQDEEGPWGIFARLQAWVATKPDKVGGLYRGFNCFYCLSIWVALPFAILLPHPTLIYFLSHWFGLSAGAIFLNYVSIKQEQ